MCVHTDDRSPSNQTTMTSSRSRWISTSSGRGARLADIARWRTSSGSWPWWPRTATCTAKTSFLRCLLQQMPRFRSVVFRWFCRSLPCIPCIPCIPCMAYLLPAFLSFCVPGSCLNTDISICRCHGMNVSPRIRCWPFCVRGAWLDYLVIVVGKVSSTF